MFSNLFNRKYKYSYLVSYKSGIYEGDIEIVSPYKLDSYEKLNETREIIKAKTGHNTVVILNIILLKREINKED